MGRTHINVRNEPKQSVFLEVSSLPHWRRLRSLSVCLGADCCQDVQLTLTWKKNPDRIKKNFFFFKHTNIFHILEGVVEAGPGWKFGEV